MLQFCFANRLKTQNNPPYLPLFFDFEFPTFDFEFPTPFIDVLMRYIYTISSNL